MRDPLQEAFLSPPDEFTPVPFWFWNDALNKEEILSQMANFRSKGVMGFVIHPRIGLPREIGYLSEAFLDLVEAAVDAAAESGMIVYLYDEGMYPSGSAHGMVVDGHPELASRGLKMRMQSVNSALALRTALEAGEHLVSAQAVRWKGREQIDLSASQILDIAGGEIQFEPPDEGNWSVILFLETFSQGVIRGIHFGEDDWEDSPPLSADLLNPAATARFIHLTHERYYRRLKRHFGQTIQAIFTDEPNILGRRSLPDLAPWTSGLLEQYLSAGGLETDLPVLWLDAGSPETASTRRRFSGFVQHRLAEAFYRPLSSWCATHGIALTGHPSGSDDISMLHYFHIPGQDQVLRWVAPEDEKGLVGPHSTLAKCSSDAARHDQRRRNVVECFGACSQPGTGWNLTGDDLKWMMDWLFVRGVNGLIPHAFFYSIRGPRRSGERPPDVGPNNIWWPDYETMVRYIKRMSWLMTDSVNVTELAVLAEANRLPWEIVRPLYECQIEFNYLEENLLLSKDCQVEAGELRAAKQRYRVLLIDLPERLHGPLIKRLMEFLTSGGIVVVCSPDRVDTGLPGVQWVNSPAELPEILLSLLQPNVSITPPNPHLRTSHIKKGGQHFYLLVNEGETAIECELSPGVRGQVQVWDAWRGTIIENACAAMGLDGRMLYKLYLERRESLILRIDQNQSPRLGPVHIPQHDRRVVQLNSTWTLNGGPTPVVIDHLESWTNWPGWESFSGTVTYTCFFTHDVSHLCSTVILDLGGVGELARVRANGVEVGFRWWAPYRFHLEGLIEPGANRLEIEVTNSLSNRMDGERLISGLLGPVLLMY